MEFNNLPGELLLYIFSYLDVKDLINISKVSCRLNGLAKSKAFWRDVDLTISTCTSSLLYTPYDAYMKLNYSILAVAPILRKITITDLNHYETFTQAVRKILKGNVKMTRKLKIKNVYQVIEGDLIKLLDRYADQLEELHIESVRFVWDRNVKTVEERKEQFETFYKVLRDEKHHLHQYHLRQTKTTLFGVKSFVKLIQSHTQTLLQMKNNLRRLTLDIFEFDENGFVYVDDLLNALPSLEYLGLFLHGATQVYVKWRMRDSVSLEVKVVDDREECDQKLEISDMVSNTQRIQLVKELTVIYSYTFEDVYLFINNYLPFFSSLKKLQVFYACFDDVDCQGIFVTHSGGLERRLFPSDVSDQLETVCIKGCAEFVFSFFSVFKNFFKNADVKAIEEHDPYYLLKM